MFVNKNVANFKSVCIIIIVLILLVFFYLQNNWISKTRHKISFQKLPKNYHGLKIIHISDLHNKSFGKEQEYLISQINKENPNIIVITGDLIDSRRYNEYIAMKFIEEAVKIAPVYYVTGNHEIRSGSFEDLEKKLVDTGVKVLRNSWEKLDINGESIFIVGIDDPHSLEKNKSSRLTKEYLDIATKGLDAQGFKILLAHRPEKIHIYAEDGFDLVFSGHAHGGQFRFPFLGGFVVPNQGFFPKYTSGKHIVDHTMIIISRGLGNSIIPQRVFNRPEIVITELLAE